MVKFHLAVSFRGAGIVQCWLVVTRTVMAYWEPALTLLKHTGAFFSPYCVEVKASALKKVLLQLES